MQPRVARRRRRAGRCSTAVGPPTSAPRAAPRARPTRSSGDERRRPRSSTGRGSRHDAEQHARGRPAATGRATRATPAHAAEAARDGRRRCAASGTTTSVGAVCALRERLARAAPGPATDSTASRNELPCVSPVGEVQDARAQHDEQQRRRRAQTRARARGDALGRRRARRRGSRRRPSSPKCGIVRPERPAAEDRRAARAAGSASTSIATAMPIAPIGPRPAVPLTLASDRRQQRGADGHARGEDRRARRGAAASAIASCLSSWRRSSSR